MQRIMVHPDLLDEKARMVQQKKQELERMVWELEKSIYMLQSEWSGITGEKFFQDFRLAREVFPTTLGLLSSIQNEFTFIANNFRTTDNTGEVALYIPEELKRDFTVGLLDGSVGETVTGIGDAANALWHDPFGTLASLGYGLTVGRVVDVGRGISFAWDALWGTGTARSDAEKFVEEQKKMITEDKTGYYGGALTGQALAYVFFGRALRSVDNKHGEIGGSSGGKSETSKQKKSEELTASFNEPIKTKTNKGLEVEFINPSGNKIHWVEQHSGNIPNAIESAMGSANPGKALEGMVANHVNKITELTGFGLQLNDITNKEFAGDLDVVTKKQIIEVKRSTSALDMDQIDKYINSSDPKFFNYELKEVIVYIDKPIDMTNKYIAKDINQLKDLGVTVVNSLDELEGVLK